MLDNFEHLLPAADLVTHLLAQAPGLTVVVTSRTPARASRRSTSSTVPPLPVPGHGAAPDVVAATDAVVLFLDRARSARPGFELTDTSTTTVGQLCARLDGLPLAIELAAARVDLLSPAAILTRLDQQLDLLADDRAGQPARHRSLRAAIDTSYDLLDQREQDVFCDLSVFAGGFTVATAEQVVSAGHPLLVDVVRSLLRASLLHPAGTPGDEPRFEMLQTVRTYSRDQLEQTGRSANAARCPRQRLPGAGRGSRAPAAGPRPVAVAGPGRRRSCRTSGRRCNGRCEAATSTPGCTPPPACGGSGRSAATPTKPGATWRRCWPSRRARPRPAPPGTSPSPNAPSSRATCDAVREHVAAAMEVHRRSGDTRSVAFGLVLLGASAGRAGDADHGEPLLREAIDLATAVGDDWLVAMGLGYLGMTVSTQGRYVEARHRLEDGLRGVRQCGDSRLVGWFLTNLGQVALADGDLVRARRRFSEALTWERRLADDWSEAWALQGLASVAIQDGAIADAVDLLIQSLATADRAQSQPATASALGLLATVAFTTGTTRARRPAIGRRQPRLAPQTLPLVPRTGTPHRSNRRHRSRLTRAGTVRRTLGNRTSPNHRPHHRHRATAIDALSRRNPATARSLAATAPTPPPKRTADPTHQRSVTPPRRGASRARCTPPRMPQGCVRTSRLVHGGGSVGEQVDQLGSARDAEFREHVCQVSLHSSTSDVQPLRDLTVAVAGGGEVGHLTLGGSERVDAGDGAPAGTGAARPELVAGPVGEAKHAATLCEVKTPA